MLGERRMPKSKEKTVTVNAVTAINSYRDVSAILKTNIIRDINKALTDETIKMESETEKDRLLSLLSSLIDIHQANGHEQFTRLVR